MTTIPGVEAAVALDLRVEVRDVGQSTSMEEHEGKLGVEQGSLCKTLVVRRADDDYAFVVVSGGRRMSWGKLRRALGVKRASMTARDEVEAVTGYVPGTVTVLGSTRRLPVILDAVAAGFETIAIGSGIGGVSLLVATADLICAVEATVADVTEPA